MIQRCFAIALGLLLALTVPAFSVDLTGTWTICGDCRVGGVCDPLSGSPTTVDQWIITQIGSTLVIDDLYFPDATGSIDPSSGAFSVPHPPNLIAFAGVGTFSTIMGTYDSTIQSGSIVGARQCNPLAPACDDATTCTDDACVSMAIGTCSDMTPVPVCTNTQNGSCNTTTSTSTSTTTTTSTLPGGHHPVTGSRLTLKQSASGRETLIFVTKDPSVFVPVSGGPDDPTLVGVQVDVHSPVGSSSAFAIHAPPGMDRPGWNPSPLGLYKFKNSSAPAGISVVRLVRLQAGKGMKVIARATGLPMTTALGSIGVAVRLSQYGAGLPVICAHFGPASVRKDTPPVFVAGSSPAPTNCNPGTLSAP